MREFRTLVYKSNTNKNTEQLKWFLHTTAALVFPLICFVCLAWQTTKANTSELLRINEFITYFDNHMDHSIQQSGTYMGLKDHGQTTTWKVLIQELAANACPLCQKKEALEKDQHTKELKEKFSSKIIFWSGYVALMSQHINIWIL